MMHAYEPVQVSAFTMSGKVYFYAISDAVKAIEDVTLTISVYDWFGTKHREEKKSISLAPLASALLFEPVSIESFLSDSLWG